MKILFIIIFVVITAYFAICVLYIFLFSSAGLFYRNREYAKANYFRRFAILVPVYKADDVIEELASNVFLQDYPHFDLIVIADSMDEEVIHRLKQISVKVMNFTAEHRTKALALNTAMAQLPDNEYDIALILDADNLIKDRDYLSRLNDAFDTGLQAIQTHRIAKNINTSLAVLDAVSEEINHALFRRGPVVLGFSSSLCGSAMAFDYKLYKDQMKNISSSGEDKELEIRLLRNRIHIEYLNDLVVLDEKTQYAGVFVTQRARWIANQIMQARNNSGEGFIQLFRGNFDFFNKVLQYFMLPRIILLVSSFVVTSAAVIFLPLAYYGIWGILFAALSLSMLFSTPRRMYNMRLLISMRYLPVCSFLIFRSLFRMKGATRKFHVTEHGKIGK